MADQPDIYTITSTTTVKAWNPEDAEIIRAAIETGLGADFGDTTTTLAKESK